MSRELYRELMSVMHYWVEDDLETGLQRNVEARVIFTAGMAAAAAAGRIQLAEDLRLLTYESLKLAAPHRFDEYCQALEFNRPVEKRFYLPRRKTLLPLIEALQDLADDKLDELFLNLPPRVGKTTMIVYFVTWVIGRNSELSNLYSSYSDVITRAFYNAVLEILDDQFTYTWREIFPQAKMGNRSADTETLNIDRNKHYPSLTCRSLYGTLNGACIAQDTLVPTRSGYKKIQDVTADDYVWDGGAWVSCGGAVCRGKKPVLDYFGIRATADHVCYTAAGQEPIAFGDAKDGQTELYCSAPPGLECPDCESTSGADFDYVYDIVNAGENHRYAVTGRGIIVHNCDCDGFLIADDLISGIEEALNKDRLIAAWSKVDNNLLPRAKMSAKLLWVGTRWSIIDPPGLRMDLLENSDEYKTRRYKIISVPALDDNDESNFDYAYGVGFDTRYFRERRASFERNNDIASWNAQYQNMPIERAGSVFEPADMQYYDGQLPDGEPDRAFMVVDPSFGGGDYCAGPVFLQYGDLAYIPAVVYTSEDKRTSQPLIAQLCARYGLSSLQIEANAATESFADGVREELDQIGYHCVIRTKNAPNSTSKNQRIFDKAPDIREHFVYLQDGRRPKEYQMFMQNLFSFKLVGKNKNDDAPDVMAQAADYMFIKPPIKPMAVLRPF